MGIVLAGDASIRELSKYADDVVKPLIEGVNGVGGVQLAGDREREIRIWLRVNDLTAHNLAAQDVVDVLKEGNIEFPGGQIETGSRELTVRTKSKVTSAEGFRRLVVARRNAQTIRLEQVAHTEDGLEDEASLARLNGQSAISLSVRQQSGANLVGVAKDVKAELDKPRSELPACYELLVVQDNSSYVESSVNEAQGELIRGAGLAVLVILFFLRSLRGSLVAAVTIPTTIIATYPQTMKGMNMGMMMSDRIVGRRETLGMRADWPMAIMGLMLAVRVLSEDLYHLVIETD